LTGAVGLALAKGRVRDGRQWVAAAMVGKPKYPKTTPCTVAMPLMGCCFPEAICGASGPASAKRC